MRNKTIYTKYRFSSINNLVFADDDKWYLVDNFKTIKIRYKNGRNGIYINRKFKSIRQLRKLAYKHRELLIKPTICNYPF